ncbi:fused MFS/spermidine synthase, partial [bacterium]|nr:fused MFS/spermidine synthase [bacterium]
MKDKLSIFIISFTSITVQIFLLKELLFQFHGNELTIGITLASWLLWTGIGSLLAGIISKKTTLSKHTLPNLQNIFGFILIGALILTRYFSKLTGIQLFEIQTILTIFFTANAILILPCIVDGFFFTLFCKKLQKIGTVYIVEALGAVFAGIVCSFLLLSTANYFLVFIILALINSVCAFLSFPRKRESQPFRPSSLVLRTSVISACIIFEIFLLANPKLLNKIDTKTLSNKWPYAKLIEHKNSIYGTVSILEYNNQTSIAYNGEIAATFPDKLPNENIAHLSLISHPNPKKILLLGGGSYELLQEILKHDSVKQIYYLEIDPMIIKTTKPLDQLTDEQKQKIKIIYTDAGAYLNKTKECFDVIISNLSDPSTLQLNRFYTAEFFEQTKKHLNPKGLLSINCSSYENYINPQLENMLVSILKSIKPYFKNTKVFPLERIHILSSDDDYLSTDPEIILNRLNQEKIKTDFFNEHYLPFELTQTKTTYLNNVIKNNKEAEINTNNKPVCYLYNILFTESLTGNKLIKFYNFLSANINKLKQHPFLYIPILLILGLLIFLFTKLYSKTPLIICIMTISFSCLFLETLSLLSFQILYGYLIYYMNIIICAFMLGLAIGGFLANKKFNKLNAKTYKQAYLLLILLIATFPFLLKFQITKHLFFMLSLTGGTLGGYLFINASQIFIHQSFPRHQLSFTRRRES